MVELLQKGFPTNLIHDVEIITKTIPSELYNNRLATNHGERFILSGSSVHLPYRLYVKEDIVPDKLMSLTPTQKLIMHCIYTRSCKGFLRQRHLEMMLEHDLPAWSYPYILKISGEYVAEILEVVYAQLRKRDNSSLKAFCKDNILQLSTGYARMISYWDAYYRRGDMKHYPRSNYVGYKLFCECFGYSKNFESLATAQRKQIKGDG